MNKKFIPVMLTPFQSNGGVDYDGLTHLTEYYLTAGAQGLFANCLSSEMYALTDAERLRVVEHVVKVSNGMVPVVATGTFAGSLNEQADFIKRMYDLGTHAVIIVTGILATEQEHDEVLNKRIFDLLGQTGNIPLGFYECPVPYKRLLSASQLKLFMHTGRITYFKNTCFDISEVRAKIDAGSGYHFGLYEAYIVNALKSLRAGCAGLSCIQGNYFPELVVWLCENYDSHEHTVMVERVINFFVENLSLMHDDYPVSAKYCLQKQGVNISTTVRVTSVAFVPDARRGVDKLLEGYFVFKRELGLKG